MKKYFKILSVVLIANCFFSVCKKDSKPAKDYGSLINGKILTGEFTYQGQPLGYYSAQFNADSDSGSQNYNWQITKQ